MKEGVSTEDPLVPRHSVSLPRGSSEVCREKSRGIDLTQIRVKTGSTSVSDPNQTSTVRTPPAPLAGRRRLRGPVDPFCTLRWSFVRAFSLATCVHEMSCDRK